MGSNSLCTLQIFLFFVIFLWFFFSFLVNEQASEPDFYDGECYTRGGVQSQKRRHRKRLWWWRLMTSSVWWSMSSKDCLFVLVVAIDDNDCWRHEGITPWSSTFVCRLQSRFFCATRRRSGIGSWRSSEAHNSSWCSRSTSSNSSRRLQVGKESQRERERADREQRERKKERESIEKEKSRGKRESREGARKQER